MGQNVHCHSKKEEMEYSDEILDQVRPTVSKTTSKFCISLLISNYFSISPIPIKFVICKLILSLGLDLGIKHSSP